MAEGPKRPVNLRAAGRRLWDAVLPDYELDPAELRALEAACRTLDELGRLEREIRKSPTLTVGSTGQVVVHPLFGEVRAHRTVLARLLREVGLAQAEEDLLGHSSAAGRALVRHRWGA